MKTERKEIERRTATAFAAIKRVMDDGEGDSSVALFVSHHLEELDATYWKKHAGVPRPSPTAVLGLLRLRSHWGHDDEDGIDNFDFTLPDDVTDYLISVRFDENGDVEAIDMES